MLQVYLDSSATTPLDARVLEAMTPFFMENYGNASSIHTLGQKARAAVEESRAQVAEIIAASPREIVFTSGGTESDNMALRGAAYRHRHRGRHIITSAIEHPAVLRTCEQLEKEGFEVTVVPVGRSGLVRLESIEQAITGETILISIMHANNEVGTIQPIPEISALARPHKILVHTDAVQSVGKIPVNVKELGVDLLTLSAHKIHGPKGVGALYVRRGVHVNPLLLGGSHERHRRAGTENVPGVVGLGRACELAREALGDMGRRVRGLRDRLEAGIFKAVPDTHLNGSTQDRLPHITNISFRYLEGEALLISLDFSGIAVSTGAACSSGSLEPSHVLRAIGLSSELAHGSIRFSLSRMTTDEEIERVLEVLPPTIERMREMSPLYKEG